MAGVNIARIGASVRRGVSSGRAFLGKSKLASMGSSTFKTAKTKLVKRSPFAQVRRVQGTAMTAIRSNVGRGTYSGMQKASNIASRMGFRSTSARLSQNAPRAAGFMSRNIGKIGVGAAVGATGYGLARRKKKNRMGGI